MPKDVPSQHDYGDAPYQWKARDDAENEIAKYVDGADRRRSSSRLKWKLIIEKIRRSINPATGKPNFPRNQ